MSIGNLYFPPFSLFYETMLILFGIIYCGISHLLGSFFFVCDVAKKGVCSIFIKLKLLGFRLFYFFISTFFKKNKYCRVICICLICFMKLISSVNGLASGVFDEAN